MSFISNSNSKRVLYLSEQNEELEKAKDHIAILNAEKNTLKRMVQELLSTQEVQLLLTQEETASLQLSRSPSQKSPHAMLESPPVTSSRSRDGSLKVQNIKNASQSSFSNRHQQLLERDKAAEKLKQQQKEIAYEKLVDQLEVLKQTVQQLEQSNIANVKLLSKQNEKMTIHEQLKKDVTSLLHDLGQMQVKIEDVEKEKEDLKHQFALKNELISNFEAENAEMKQIIQILSEKQNIQDDQKQFDEENHQLSSSQVIHHDYQSEQFQRHQQSSQQIVQSQSQANVFPDNIHSELSIQKEIFKRFIFTSQHTKKKGLQEIFYQSFEGFNRFEEVMSQGRFAEIILGLLRFNNDLMAICYHENGYQHVHKNSSPRQQNMKNLRENNQLDKKSKKNDQHSLLERSQQDQQQDVYSEDDLLLSGKEESTQHHRTIPKESHRPSLKENILNQVDQSNQQQQEHQQLLRQLKVVEQQLELSKQQQELQQSIHQQLQSSIQLQQFNTFALQQQQTQTQQQQQHSPMNPTTKPFQQYSLQNSVRSSFQQHEYPQMQQQLISFSQDNPPLLQQQPNLLQKPQFSSPSPQDYNLNKAKPNSGYSSPLNILFQDFPGSQTASPDPGQFINVLPQGNLINSQRFSLENAGQMEKNNMINQPKVNSNVNIKLENIATTTSDNLIEESNRNNGKNNMNKNGNGYDQDGFGRSFKEKFLQNQVYPGNEINSLGQNSQNIQGQGYYNEGKKKEGDTKSQMKQNNQKHHSDIEDLDRQLEMMRAEEQGLQQK